MSTIKIDDLKPTPAPSAPEAPAAQEQSTDDKSALRTRIKAGRPVKGVRG